MSIDWLVRNLAVSFFLPPLNAIVVGGLAFLLWRKYPRTARTLVLVAVAGLWLQSTPGFVMWLRTPLMPKPLTRVQDISPPPQAIVVLGGGLSLGAAEYAGTPEASITDATLGQYSLERVRYGAWLAQQTKLPLLVSGGAPEAQLMQRTLEEQFGVPVRWVEPRSTTTGGNARFSAPILDGAGIKRIYLVTDAWHMRRAVRNFTHMGLSVVPAPCGFGLPGDADGRLPFWPTAWATLETRLLLREWIGLLLGR